MILYYTSLLFPGGSKWRKAFRHRPCLPNTRGLYEFWNASLSCLLDRLKFITTLSSAGNVSLFRLLYFHFFRLVLQLIKFLAALADFVKMSLQVYRLYVTFVSFSLRTTRALFLQRPRWYSSRVPLRGREPIEACMVLTYTRLHSPAYISLYMHFIVLSTELWYSSNLSTDWTY